MICASYSYSDNKNTRKFNKGATMSDQVISRPIYDKNGNCIGNVTGRRDQVERVNNRDLNEIIERGNHEKKDREKR